MPVLAWCALLGSIAGRSLQAWIVCRDVVRERHVGKTMLLFPLRDLMGVLFWLLSYGNNRILWRGEVYELVEDGKMRRSAR
jgi:ceramide glucosyltransferase